MFKETEEQTIRAFVQKAKQERCCLLLSNPKRRKEFTAELAHFKWLEERFAHPIPSALAHTAGQIAALLRAKGAGSTVWAISEDSALDGTELMLEEALHKVLGRGMGTILSCVPGKLAFFQGEERHSERLLERLSKSREAARSVSCTHQDHDRETRIGEVRNVRGSALVPFRETFALLPRLSL